MRDGESDVGGHRNNSLNSITMPNGLLPVLEEELQWQTRARDEELIVAAVTSNVCV